MFVCLKTEPIRISTEIKKYYSRTKERYSKIISDETDSPTVPVTSLEGHNEKITRIGRFRPFRFSVASYSTLDARTNGIIASSNDDARYVSVYPIKIIGQSVTITSAPHTELYLYVVTKPISIHSKKNSIFERAIWNKNRKYV